MSLKCCWLGHGIYHEGFVPQSLQFQVITMPINLLYFSTNIKNVITTNEWSSVNKFVFNRLRFWFVSVCNVGWYRGGCYKYKIFTSSCELFLCIGLSWLMKLKSTLLDLVLRTLIYILSVLGRYRHNTKYDHDQIQTAYHIF